MILDLHAAPGGQVLTSESRTATRTNLRCGHYRKPATDGRVVARIARRYAQSLVGGWIGERAEIGIRRTWARRRLNNKNNRPIAALYNRITAAIREHDHNHLIVIEGNCWGDNQDHANWDDDYRWRRLKSQDDAHRCNRQIAHDNKRCSIRLGKSQQAEPLVRRDDADGRCRCCCRGHRLGAGALEIAAVDYDLGPPGVAYADRVDANYHVTTGGERTEWNDGRTYGDDGVDIDREPDGTPYVTAFERGEWMQYTLEAAAAGPRAAILILDKSAREPVPMGRDGTPVGLPVQAGGGWQTVPVPPLAGPPTECPPPPPSFVVLLDLIRLDRKRRGKTLTRADRPGEVEAMPEALPALGPAVPRDPRPGGCASHPHRPRDADRVGRRPSALWSCSMNACRRSGSARPSSFLAFFHDSRCGLLGRGLLGGGLLRRSLLGRRRRTTPARRALAASTEARSAATRSTTSAPSVSSSSDSGSGTPAAFASTTFSSACRYSSWYWSGSNSPRSVSMYDDAIAFSWERISTSSGGAANDASRTSSGHSITCSTRIPLGRLHDQRRDGCAAAGSGGHAA